MIQLENKLLKEGYIITKKGEILEKHNGIHRYTIGQRKGLGISWKHPLYVIEIDAVNNNIIVGKNDDLFTKKVKAVNLNWLNKNHIRGEKITAKVRYTQKAENAIITKIKRRFGASQRFWKKLLFTHGYSSLCFTTKDNSKLLICINT